MTDIEPGRGVTDALVVRRQPGMTDAEWRDWCGYVRVVIALASAGERS